MYTQSELEALKITEIEEDTDVEGLRHFAAIIPKDGNARPFLVQQAALSLYMSKASVDVCSRAFPGSNVPPTRTVTSLQLHFCCQLLLDGFDFTLLSTTRTKAKRLYVAELARCMARAAARQRVEAAVAGRCGREGRDRSKSNRLKR